MITQDIARNIKKVRKQRKMSQEQLGVNAGLTRNYISLVESAKRTPSVHALDKIANVLCTTASSLVREENTVELAAKIIKGIEAETEAYASMGTECI